MKATSTGWLYHPFASGARDAACRSTLGGVLSYLIVIDADAEFPALSVHVPETRHGATVGAAVRAAYVQRRHARGAVVAGETEPTGFVYHPLLSGPREGRR